MKRFLITTFIFMIAIALLGCSQYQTIEQTFEFHFGDGDWNFQVIYADYHDDSNQFETYEFSYGPFEVFDVDTSYKGWMVNGHNRSDDLFMGVFKELQFQKQNHSYYLQVTIKILTSEESGSIGIGGSPADSVYLKAGFVRTEPTSTLDSETGLYQLNLDKGNQSQDGTDLKNVGTIAKPENVQAAYGIKTLSLQVQVKTNAAGKLFFVFGSDSGFEGYTSLKLLSIQMTARPR